MKNLIPKLEEISKENNNSALIADYLLNYQGDLGQLRITHICDDLYVSIASATRLSKRLGLDGFNQLKVYLAEEKIYSQNSKQNYININSNKYYDNINDSLKMTLGQLNEQELAELATKVSTATRINLFAVGGSNITLFDFARKLMKLKMNVTCHSDVHLQYIEAQNSEFGTLAIGLTYSGLTKDVIENLIHSKENGATTVLLTNNRNIHSQYIDEYIYIESNQSSSRTFSIATRISTIAVLDLIYLSIIDSDPAFYYEILQKNRVIKY